MTRALIRSSALAACLAAALPAAAQESGPAAACRAFTDAVASATPDVEAQLGEAFCGAVGDLAAELEAARERVEELETRLTDAEPWVPPPGAVVLVDDERGCPDGWTDIGVMEPDVFAGRVPVAAGVGIPGEVPRHRELGGAATVALSAAEVPPHDHDLPMAFARAPDGVGSPGATGFASGSTRNQIVVRARAGRERTGRTGAGAAHENRPPFVALYWCRRD